MEDSSNITEEIDCSHYAKYQGELKLGTVTVDCYVLEDGSRVISCRATVKALADVESGNLSSYIDINPLRSYIDARSILEKMVEFRVPGSSLRMAKGISAENFLDICRAYVFALNASQLATERQKTIGIKCAMLLASCAKVGLIALVDEATGYQQVRDEDELQFKLKLFLAEEMREWEKTFPDELWEQFGRLDQWKHPLQNRPKWWGKLVMELIYEALDPDVAKNLRENKPTPRHGQNYHQWLTENYGLQRLVAHINQVIGLAKTCESIQELRDLIAHHFKNQPIQQRFLNKLKGRVK